MYITLINSVTWSVYIASSKLHFEIGCRDHVRENRRGSAALKDDPYMRIVRKAEPCDPDE